MYNQDFYGKLALVCNLIKNRYKEIENDRF